MHLSLRFIAPLAVALALLAYALVPLVDRLTLRWWVNDLDTRSQLIANTLQEQLAELVEQGATTQVEQLFIAPCRTSGCTRWPFATPRESCATRRRRIRRRSAAGRRRGGGRSALVVRLRQVRCTSWSTAAPGDRRIGTLVLVHDMSFVDRRSEDTRRYLICLFIVLGVVIVADHGVDRPAVLARLGRRRARAAARRRHPAAVRAARPAPELQPLASDLRALLRDLEASTGALRRSSAIWSPEALRASLRERAARRRGASSSPTASRTSTTRDGDGDRAAAAGERPGHRARAGDARVLGHLDRARQRHAPTARPSIATTASRCRPSNPSYTLRRVWLTQEEEQGYYYGFANEGLWPLCHIAHVRPVFRASRLGALRRASTSASPTRCVDEARTEDPIVLVQDYHFALLPRMIRERLPQRDDHHVLAHPVAESGVVRHLPVARGAARRHARQHASSASTRSFHCKQLPRHRRPLPRGAHRARDRSTISYGGQRRASSRYPISIEWPPRSGSTGSCRCRCAAPRCVRERTAARRRAARRRRRPPRLHQGHPRALHRGRAAARAASELDRPLRVRADRRAVALVARRVPQLRGRASRALAARINARFGTRRLRADPAQGRASRARRRSTSTTAPPTSAS